MYILHRGTQVVNVAMTSATPCMHVYPAVLALARSFVGYAAFGRLMGDQSAESQELLKDLNIVEVPTFIFYRWVGLQYSSAPCHPNHLL